MIPHPNVLLLQLQPKRRKAITPKSVANDVLILNLDVLILNPNDLEVKLDFGFFFFYRVQEATKLGEQNWGLGIEEPFGEKRVENVEQKWSNTWKT